MKNGRMSIVLVLIMTATSFTAFSPAAGPNAAPILTVTKEWTGGPYNATPTILLNDTDGDGLNELVMWLNSGRFGPGGGGGTEEHWIKVYDLPGYTLAWTANFSGNVDVELDDLGHNGSVELLLTLYDSDGTYFQAVSGNGFQTLWTSEHFGGDISDRRLIDVDADQDLELVLVNYSMTDDKVNLTFETHILIINAKSGQNEWESPALDGAPRTLETKNIDADQALELLLTISNQFNGQSADGGSASLQVFDGGSHDLQWNFTDANLTGLSFIQVGNIDADRTVEVVMQYSEDNGTALSAGFAVLAGPDGSLKWDQGFENASVSASAADINNDTVIEILLRTIESKDNITSTVTYYIFDPKTKSQLWKLGPFPLDMGSSSGFSAQDITGDGVPEVVVSNETMDMFNRTNTYSWDVFDGASLSLLWSSPELAGYASSIYALPLDSDKDWEIVQAESWTDSDGNEHGVVHIFSTGTWTEEWKSEDYGAQIYLAVGLDAVNDSRPELLVKLFKSDPQNRTSIEQLLIIDSDTHSVLFASPWLSLSQSEFADLYGSPRNEIVLTSVEGDMMSAESTQLVVYNDTTFQEAWRSEKLDGYGTIEKAGDFDGDGRGELMLQSWQWDEKFNTVANVTVYEFSEQPARMPDLAIAAGDLTLSNATPMAGMPVVLSARVHNVGDADAACATVALHIDGTQAAAATVDVPAGGTAWVNFTWTARVGDHVLTVRLDPRNLVAEWNEDNNNASLNISVSRPTKPVAVISSPTEGQQFSAGDTITFDGSASFAPEGSTFYWTSEQDGYLGGEPVFNATLPAGDHYVTLFVDDGHNNVSATVNFTVAGTPPPPGSTWAVITSPRNGAVFTAGDAISFDGSRSAPAKPEYGLTYAWSSNITGALGNASAFSMALPQGYHNISLTVDDGHGGTSTAHVNIRVKEAPAVIAVISSPSEGQSFEVAQSVMFDASGTTGPSGAILAYLWSSSISGPLSTQKAFSQRLAAGNHTISLTASDGRGHNGSAAVNITVRRSVNYPPVVNITSPADGATVGGVVTVSGTAWDDAKVVAVYIMIDNGSWGTASGTDNWTYSWNTNTSRYPNGPHKITVKASDDTQSSPQVSVTVTVSNNKPPGPPVKPAQSKADNTMLYVGVGAAIVIAAAAAAAVIMLRRRAPPGQPLPVQDSRGIVPPRM
jgi:hypothetical protein